MSSSCFNKQEMNVSLRIILTLSITMLVNSSVFYCLCGVPREERLRGLWKIVTKLVCQAAVHSKTPAVEDGTTLLRPISSHIIKPAPKACVGLAISGHFLNNSLILGGFRGLSFCSVTELPSALWNCYCDPGFCSRTELHERRSLMYKCCPSNSWCWRYCEQIGLWICHCHQFLQCNLYYASTIWGIFHQQGQLRISWMRYIIL